MKNRLENFYLEDVHGGHIGQAINDCGSRIIIIEFTYDIKYNKSYCEIDFEPIIKDVEVYIYNEDQDKDVKIKINKRNYDNLCEWLPEKIREAVWDNYHNGTRESFGVEVDYCEYPTDEEMYL